MAKATDFVAKSVGGFRFAVVENAIALPVERKNELEVLFIS